MSPRTRVSIDRQAITQFAISQGNKAIEALVLDAFTETQEVLKETDRFHPHRSDTLINNLVIEKQLGANGEIQSFLIDKAEHAYMQEFGAPSHVVVVNEKMQEYYGFPIGSRRRVYHISHESWQVESEAEKMHPIMYKSAQPFLAPGMLRAIAKFRKKRSL